MKITKVLDIVSKNNNNYNYVNTYLNFLLISVLFVLYGNKDTYYTYRCFFLRPAFFISVPLFLRLSPDI